MTAKQEAHEAIKPKLTALQEAILANLREANTINGIRDALLRYSSTQYAYSTITARLSELEEMGLIYKGDISEAGQTIWERTPKHKIADMAQLIREKRFRAWRMQGEKYLDLMPDEIKKYYESYLGLNDV